MTPALAGLGLALAAAGAPLAAFFQSRAVVPVVAVGAAISLVQALRRSRRPAGMDGWFAAILALICAWAAVSIAWTVDTGFGVSGTTRLTGNMVVGAVLFTTACRLTMPEAHRVERALFLGFGVTLSMLFVEILFGGPLTVGMMGLPFRGRGGFFWLNAATAVLILMVWPAAFFAWRRYGAGAGLAAFPVLALLLALMTYWTGLAALVLGGLAAALVHVFRRRAVIAFAALFAVAVAAAPILPQTVMRPDALIGLGIVPPPLQHRLHIWAFTAERIAEHPIRGWGINASRVMPGGKSIVGGEAWSGHALPLHPHNAPLQVWLELGLPGALLFGGLGVLLFLRVARPGAPRGLAVIATGQIVSALALLSSSYGVWQSWWLATLWTAASVTATAYPTGPPEAPG